MRQQLTDGRWVYAQTEQQFNNLRRCGKLTHDSMSAASVQKGTFVGPGRYLLLEYEERCPRNCCELGVFELLSAQEVIEETKEQMREFAELLKTARFSNCAKGEC